MLGTWRPDFDASCWNFVPSSIEGCLSMLGTLRPDFDRHILVEFHSFFCTGVCERAQHIAS